MGWTIIQKFTCDLFPHGISAFVVPGTRISLFTIREAQGLGTVPNRSLSIAKASLTIYAKDSWNPALPPPRLLSRESTPPAGLAQVDAAGSQGSLLLVSLLPNYIMEHTSQWSFQN